MTGSRHRPATCRDCGRHAGEVGLISRAGLCAGCGLARMQENAAGLSAQEGPAWDRWQAGMANWLERARST